MKEKIAIGFDLGTTSVGWSVVKISDIKDNNNDRENRRILSILDMGVRLFDDPASSDSNIQARRIARGRRRRIHRQKIRKYDLFKLLLKFNLVKDYIEFEDLIKKPVYDKIEENYKLPVEIKIKGLTQNLTKHELILILHNYIKHRGSLNTIDLSEEEEKNKEKDKNLYDKNKYPCENQYDWFLATGKIIGNKGNYLINNDDFIKEINLILSNQKNLGINDDFISEFINLFKRHRHYSEGPGSENSLSKYGRVEKIKDEKGNIEKLIWLGNDSNLWDLLVGKCTYYPNEFRNYKKSPITEIFNLLNDLSNMKITVDGEKSNTRYLTKEEKEIILSLPYDKLTLDKMMKAINFKKSDILSGIKGINDKKPEIEELKSTRSIVKWLVSNKFVNNINLNKMNDLKLIDQIFVLGVKKQNTEERIKYFIEHDEAITKFNELKIIANHDQLEELAKLKIYSTGTASLSSKAQLEYIKFSLTKDGEGKNQMHYFTESEEFREIQNKFEKYKYFPQNYFENEIIPSTVKRTFNQAIKVLNAILKKYKNYQLTHIVIELARELNSKEEANRIHKELENNKKTLEEKMKFHGISKDRLKSGENRLKFILWDQQNKQDIYDGQTIDLSDLLLNPTDYHIDHILPVSISFIDSMQNKVLTKAINNELKSDKTPYQWLSSLGKYEDYKIRCQNLLNEVQNKKEKAKLENKINNYLLYEKDPFNELQGFVSRQLNDTRYISSEFSRQLKDFFKQSKYWKDNKVIINAINGNLTTFARRNLFYESDLNQRLLIKNRDIYNHHAIDASIILYLGLNSKIEKLLKYKSKAIIKREVNGQEQYIDLATGEIVANKFDFFKEEATKSQDFRDQMRKFLDPNKSSHFVRFSRMLINKNNTPLSNETIYSIKQLDQKHYKLSKLSLLNSKNVDLAKYFGDTAENKEKLLIYQNERSLYEKLNSIYNDEKYNINKNANPFLMYLQSDFVDEKISLKNKQILDKIPIFDNQLKITHWIRNLKVAENEINLDEILKLKNHQNNAFYDSLKFIGIRVYKTFANNYQTLFLSALNLKWDKYQEKLISDEEKIDNMLLKLNIDKSKGYLEIKRGMTLINNNDLYYFNGGGSRKTNTLEIKPLSCENKIGNEILKRKKIPKSNRLIITVSTLSKEFKLCKVDTLGHVYDIQTFDQFFENLNK